MTNRTPAELNAAWRYIRAIRNTDKREYAVRYFDFLRGYGDEPEPMEFRLSYMGSQAARMRLHEIIKI